MTGPDRGETRGGVLRAYAEVMALVQEWERAQAILWFSETRPKKRRPSADLHSASNQKEIRRLQKAFLKTTAQETRKVLAPLFDAECANELNALTTNRNWLAHTALMDRGLDDGSFRHGTATVLRGFGERYFASRRAVMRVADERAVDYTGLVMPGWEEAARDILDRLQRGEQVLTHRQPKS